MIDASENFLLGQYSLLAVPFLIMVLGMLVSKFKIK